MKATLLIAVLVLAGCATKYPIKDEFGHSYRLVRPEEKSDPGKPHDAALYERQGTTNTYIKMMSGLYVQVR